MDSKEDQTDQINYAEARKLTGLPMGTLYCKVSRREIPHFRHGKRQVMFSRKALQDWLAGHEVQV